MVNGTHFLSFKSLNLVMIYQLDGTLLLFALNRIELIDISIGDTLQVKGFPAINYLWTAHDSSLIETNPDDDIFLEVERTPENEFKAVRIAIK
jgi:hypothetical protein